MEQELASISEYILDIECIKPYYYKVPDNFVKPSIYFPVPEFSTSLDSTDNYRVKYMWLIKVFGRTTEEAYKYANKFAIEIIKNRCRIPLLNLDGSKQGKYVDVYKPEIAQADSRVYTLQIDWDSIRPYNYDEVIKMQKHFENLNLIRRDNNDCKKVNCG